MNLPVPHDGSAPRTASFVVSGILIMLVGLIWLAGNLGLTEARELLPLSRSGYQRLKAMLD